MGWVQTHQVWNHWQVMCLHLVGRNNTSTSCSTHSCGCYPGYFQRDILMGPPLDAKSDPLLDTFVEPFRETFVKTFMNTFVKTWGPKSVVNYNTKWSKHFHAVFILVWIWVHRLRSWIQVSIQVSTTQVSTQVFTHRFSRTGSHTGFPTQVFTQVCKQVCVNIDFPRSDIHLDMGEIHAAEQVGSLFLLRKVVI